MRTVYPPPTRHTVITVRLATAPNPHEEQEIERRREQEEAFDKAFRSFARVLILVSTPLGIGAILLGSLVRSVSIGTGFVLGGILTVMHGYLGYWSYADDWLLFVSVLLGLCVLLFVAHRLKPNTG